jgi:nitroreductase
MELETAIRMRFSARKFKPDPVPEDKLQRILDLAQCTPSWCNCQPWQLVITRGTATDRFREAVSAHARSGARPNPDFPYPAAYEGVYRDRRKVCGVQLYQSLGIGKDDRAAAAEQALENFRLFGAPHVAIVTTEEKLGVYGALDCGLYVQTFMLAARDCGVDTIAQAALASYPDLIRAFFGLASDRKVVCGISFGYADARDRIHSYRTERAATAEAVRFLDH